MPGDDVKYQASSVYLFFQVNMSKDARDIPVWNLAPSVVPGVVQLQYVLLFFSILTGSRLLSVAIQRGQCRVHEKVSKITVLPMTKYIINTRVRKKCCFAKNNIPYLAGFFCKKMVIKMQKSEKKTYFGLFCAVSL